MKITFATVEDASTILNLQFEAYQSEAATYRDYSIAPLTQTIQEIKAEFSEQLFFKATDSNEITGSVRAYIADDSCLIGRLIVHPKWQRKGVGTQLMKVVEAHFLDVRRYELFTGTKSLTPVNGKISRDSV